MNAGAPAAAVATTLSALAVRIEEATESARPTPARAWSAGASDSAAPSASISQYMVPSRWLLRLKRTRICAASRASQSLPPAANSATVPQLVVFSAQTAEPGSSAQGSFAPERTSMPSMEIGDHSLPTPQPA